MVRFPAEGVPMTLQRHRSSAIHDAAIAAQVSAHNCLCFLSAGGGGFIPQNAFCVVLRGSYIAPPDHDYRAFAFKQMTRIV